MRHGGTITTERGSVLWGKGAKGALVACVVALAAIAGFAHPADAARAAKPLSAPTYVPTALRTQATLHPTQLFNVIVQGRPGDKSAVVAAAFTQNGSPGSPGHLKRQFTSINGVAGSVTGKDLLKLASSPHVSSIVPDAKESGQDVASESMWRDSVDLAAAVGAGSSSSAPQAPAIAIVDSGVDSSKAADFGARVVASVDFTGTAQNADDEGHGTMVAGLAAGAGQYSGVAQNAPIVSLRTADGTGASRESDVIAACDWILANKAQYGIRVANFSMRGSTPSSFRYDPLDKAVESLWFNGVVVVAAAGNYGVNGQPTQVQYAPGNDPFVITVGALDTNGTANPSDDTAADWSVYGHTLDGFAKPDISAPGRWMVAPVPMTSYLATTAPDRIVGDGYMWMSGTSLSAPIVSGAAAEVLAVHPNWTPDQVKGALMASSSATSAGLAGGFGEVNVGRAMSMASAPNANSNLDAYITTDANGNPSFDGTSWEYALQNATDWSQTDWSQTDWSQTDWSQTDWSQTDWSQTDWSQTDWSQTDWSQTDWSATDWSQTDWSQTDWSQTDWSQTDWNIQ